MLRIEEAPEVVAAFNEHEGHKIYLEVRLLGVNIDCATCATTIVGVRN